MIKKELINNKEFNVKYLNTRMNYRMDGVFF